MERSEAHEEEKAAMSRLTLQGFIDELKALVEEIGPDVPVVMYDDKDGRSRPNAFYAIEETSTTVYIEGITS